MLPVLCTRLPHMHTHSTAPKQAHESIEQRTCTLASITQALADERQAGELVVVFGGVLGRTGARTNELSWMTTDRMEWHLQARARHLLAQAALGAIRSIIQVALSCCLLFLLCAGSFLTQHNMPSTLRSVC